MNISKTEYKVMEVLWGKQPSTSTEIIAELNKIEPWHEKTVKTLINRLVKKSAISYQKQGRSYLYSALINQADYQQAESQSFIKRLFNGKLSPLVANFAKDNSLNKQDIAELKAIIKDWENNND